LCARVDATKGSSNKPTVEIRGFSFSTDQR
jgi:hypothetical protein